MWEQLSVVEEMDLLIPYIFKLILMKYPITLFLLFVVLQLSAQETKPLYSISILSPSIGLEKSIQ